MVDFINLAIKSDDVMYDGKVKIGKVNVDQQPELASKYGVRSIPYFAFIKEGNLCDDITGSVPKSRLVSKLEAMV